jgi:hypothetical protein
MISKITQQHRTQRRKKPRKREIIKRFAHHSINNALTLLGVIMILGWL